MNFVQGVLEERDVIFSTLMCGALRRFCNYGYRPDIMIIDEAAQAYECVAWLAMMCAKRCVLAGDHHQLSALVHSPEYVYVVMSCFVCLMIDIVTWRMKSLMQSRERWSWCIFNGDIV